MTSHNFDFHKIAIEHTCMKDLLSQCGVKTKFAIAGGFVRDLILGREPKDLDVFIPFNPRYFKAEGLIENLNKLTGQEGKLLENLNEEGDEYSNFPLNFKAYEYDNLSVEGLPVQFIFPQYWCEQICNIFDFGICQVQYNENGLFMTPNFLRDLNGGTATLFHKNSLNVEKSKERLKRWLDRGFDLELIEVGLPEDKVDQFVVGEEELNPMPVVGEFANDLQDEVQQAMDRFRFVRNRIYP